MFGMLECAGEVAIEALTRFARVVHASPKEITELRSLFPEGRAKEEEFVRIFMANQERDVFSWFAGVLAPYRVAEEAEANSVYATAIGLRTGDMRDISEMQGAFDEYAMGGEEIKQFQDSYLQLQTAHKLGAEDFSRLFATYGINEPLRGRLVRELQCAGNGPVSRYNFIKVVGPLVKPNLRKQRNALFFELMAEAGVQEIGGGKREKLLSLYSKD